MGPLPGTSPGRVSSRVGTSILAGEMGSRADGTCQGVASPGVFDSTRRGFPGKCRSWRVVFLLHCFAPRGLANARTEGMGSSQIRCCLGPLPMSGALTGSRHYIIGREKHLAGFDLSGLCPLLSSPQHQTNTRWALHAIAQSAMFQHCFFFINPFHWAYQIIDVLSLRGSGCSVDWVPGGS